MTITYNFIFNMEYCKKNYSWLYNLGNGSRNSANSEAGASIGGPQVAGAGGVGVNFINGNSSKYSQTVLHF